ncbi:MAG: sigma-54-dependent Fis family transcriptional regulator [Thermoanaerobacteraceae bacterium]|nr:sigma-54-dependent Fis family transcriptional regulator [Thermoanaerobacteraceae bacterium]
MLEKRIMIVDDEVTLRLSLQAGLEDKGYLVDTADTVSVAQEKIATFQPHLLLLDIRLPDGHGLDLLETVKKSYPYLEVIIMTAYGDTDSAVRAMKLGAIDYVNKPFDLEEIYLLVEKTFSHLDLQSEVELYRQEKKSKEIELIGDSDVTKRLLEKLRLVAGAKDTTVLIQGETGTGKELAAQYIHRNSARKNRPFVAINCGVLPPNLVESELFGHEKGAFTGASGMKKGLFEWADMGTVLLDEIGELTLEMQVKLLRFLEERKFKRVGGFRDIHVDVRIIAATNRNLEQMVAEGKFRSDLYYRLNVVPVWLPPLRERGSDVILLAEYFLKQYCRQRGRKAPVLTEGVKEKLMEYPWPGNVRELKNIMERIAILHQDRLITVEDLPKEFQEPGGKTEQQTGFGELSGQHGNAGLGVLDRPLGEGFSLEKVVEEVEKGYIIKALNQTRWNISRAAGLLGISRHALQRRVDKYFPRRY